MYKPNYKLTNNILSNIARISADRQVILSSPILPQVEEKLKRDALISRTHHSTSIEGNTLSLEQVEKIAGGGHVKAAPKDEKEVKNYIKVLKYLDRIADKKEISGKTVLKLHVLISKGVVRPGTSGKYRDRMVYVVDGFGRTVFTPPQAKQVPELVRGLADWLNGGASKDVHPVLAAGIAHYELVRIHPFADGNGRTGRALATLVLYLRDFDIKHFFPLDDYYNEDRQAYYAALQYVDPKTVDITQWLEYFTEGVAAQMTRLREKIETLQKEPLMKSLGTRVVLKERQWKLMQRLKEAGRITNGEYQKLAGVTRETAKRDLAYLADAGLIKKTGKGRGAFYKLRRGG